MTTHTDLIQFNGNVVFSDDSEFEIEAETFRITYQVWGKDQQVHVISIESNEARHGEDWMTCKLPGIWVARIRKHLQKQIDDEHIRELDLALERQWEADEDRVFVEAV